MRTLRLAATCVVITASAAVAVPTLMGTNASAALPHITRLSTPASSSAPAAPASSAAQSTAPKSTATTPSATTEQYRATLGSSGEDVTTVQTWLVKLGYFTQTPTGYYGPVTAKAVTSFQTKQGLPATGSVDQVTWDALKDAAAKAPAPKPSAKPTVKPSATTPPAKAGKSSTTQVTLDQRCYTGRVMCVNKTTHRIYWVVDGQIIDSWSVRVGRPGYATREGTFHVYLKQERSWSKLYQVWMPYSMYFSGGQAVHYSSDFANNGYGVGSHGCVNMRDWNGIKWLYSQVQVGDTVVVYH